MSEIKTTREFTYFYCLNGVIKINGKERNCPPYVFKLPVSTSWRLGKDSSDTMLDLTLPSEVLNSSISDVWIKDVHVDAPSELLLKIAQLQNVISKLDPGLVELSEPGKQVMYLKQNNDIIMLSLGCIFTLILLAFCLMLAMKIKRRCIKNKKGTGMVELSNLPAPPPVSTIPSNNQSIIYGTNPQSNNNTYLSLN